MDFSAQIKKLRTQQHLTQEQMADQLHVSRQAVSNWENDRNPPDLETLIRIACVFQISLDELILGGNQMNNMTEKLIRDGSETRHSRMNLITIAIGAGLLLLGVACLLTKALIPDTIAPDGTLREAFFLLPVGFLFLLCGLITFLTAGVWNLTDAIRTGESGARQSRILCAAACGGIVLLGAGGFCMLYAANSGIGTGTAGYILSIAGLFVLILAALYTTVHNTR